MKKLVALTIFSSYLMVGLAQQAKDKIRLGPAPNPDLSKVLVIPKNFDTSTKKGKAFLDQLTKLRESHSATYSHTTAQGKVYRLRQDNMACLVPDMNQLAPMPGSKRSPLSKVRTQPIDNMPNPYKWEKIVPDKE